MKNVVSLIFALVLSSLMASAQTAPPSAPTVAPTATPAPERATSNEEDVVVITTNLIQVDATVTDKNGRPVTDLTANDFEIYENNEKQAITNFSFVSAAQPAVAETVAASPTRTAASSAPAPTVRLRPEQVRRTIALVVDDLGLSFESTYQVRRSLKKFVDEQMQAGDLVAIIRTGGGIGALQQFTGDKRQLRAAIEKVRWNPTGRGGVSAFAPIQASPAESIANATGDAGDAERAAQDRAFNNSTDNFRSDIFAVGTLGALNYIIKGMRELPGRKAVVLMSDGFRILNRDEDGNYDTAQGQRVLDSLRRLTDLANRASVVVNTVDARGLQTLGLTAADNTSDLSADQLSQRISDRRNELFDTQDGLNYLAAETGGRAFRNNNDIPGAVEKVLDDQKGYYLIGYQPDEATFNPKTRQFNRLTIKLTRPGLKIRYRSGFLGIAEGEARPTKLTAQQQVMNALTSPFGANDVNLRLNALFDNNPDGSFIRSLVHINAKDLKFVDEPDNMKKAVFDVVAYTFGDNGAPIDSISQTYTWRAKNDDVFRSSLEKGIVYQFNVPVKKPGAYQLRIALRDAQTEKVGAANQFIEVPNLKKNRLTLSGVVLQGLTMPQYQKLMQGQPPLDDNAPNAERSVDAQTATALRRFRGGSVLRYGFTVYNAKLNSAKTPRLTMQTKLFKDGKIVFEGEPSALNAGGQTDLSRINFDSAISLPPTITPGDYILQILITDALAKDKHSVASQFVDFEIIK